MEEAIEVRIARMEERDKVMESKIDKLLEAMPGYATKKELHNLEEELKPIKSWVNNRKAVEKFFVGLMGFIGFSQVVTIIIILVKLTKLPIWE